MGRYFRFLIKKIFRKKDVPKELVKVNKEALANVKKIQKKAIEYQDLGSDFNEISIMGVAIAAIVGIIALIVFSEITASLNTSAISGSTIVLFNMVPLIIAAILIIGLLTGLTGIMNRY